MKKRAATRSPAKRMRLRKRTTATKTTRSSEVERGGIATGKDEARTLQHPQMTTYLQMTTPANIVVFQITLSWWVVVLFNQQFKSQRCLAYIWKQNRQATNSLISEDGKVRWFNNPLNICQHLLSRSYCVIRVTVGTIQPVWGLPSWSSPTENGSVHPVNMYVPVRTPNIKDKMNKIWQQLSCFPSVEKALWQIRRAAPKSRRCFEKEGTSWEKVRCFGCSLNLCLLCSEVTWGPN